MDELTSEKEIPAEPLRVLLLIDHLGSGGAQAILADIVALSERGFVQPVVAYYFGSSMYTDRLESAGAEVVFFGSERRKARSWMNALLPHRLFGLARRFRPHVVHVHASTLPVMHARLLRWRCPAQRLVFTMHANVWQLTPFWKSFLRRLIPGYDRVVTEFDGSNEELRNLGVDPSRMRHIPFGARVRPVTDEEVRATRALCGAPGDEPLLLSVARLAPDRLLDRYLEAFASVVKEFPRARFALVGDGPHEGELRSRVQTLNLTENVRFLGRCTDPAPYYAACDLYVTITNAQSCDVGIAGWQAMLSGSPVVALEAEWHLPETREIPCRHLVRVLDPVDLAETLSGLLRDEERRTALGAEGRAFAERHRSASAMTKQYELLYREVVQPDESTAGSAPVQDRSG